MAKNILRVAIVLSLLVFIPAWGPAQSAGPSGPGASIYLPFVVKPGFLYLPLLFNSEPRDPLAFLGLEGGPVQVMAIDPHNTNMIYMGTWGSGIYKSTDGGQSWVPERAGLGNQLIWSLAIDPSNTSIIYTGTHKSGVYKSIDGGATWSLSSNGIQDSAVIYTIAINPANPQNIFIGTRGIPNHCSGASCPPWAGVVYRTDNGGASWTPAITDVGGTNKQFWAYSVVFDQADSTKALAAFDGSPGLLRSLDTGNTWSKATKSPTNPIGRVVLFDPTITSPVTAYYAGWQAYQYYNVFKSIDGGDTWASKTYGVGGYNAWKMAVTPSSPSIVYLGTYQNGLWMTTDGAQSWKNTGFPVQVLGDVEIDPKNGNVIYVGSANGLYKSTNGGTTFAYSQHGFITTWSTALLVSPNDKSHLYMSTYGSGVYQSTDRGLTWANMSSGLSNLFIHSMVMDPAHPNILFALTDTAGLFRYDTNVGGNWVHVSGGTPALAMGESAPEVLSYGPNYPFAVPEKPDADVHPELYADQSPTAPAASKPYLAMVFAPSAPAIAYLGTNGAGVYKTSDSGGAWSPAGLSGLLVWSLAVDPKNPSLVYAATSNAGAIKVSPDGGGSWSDSILPDAGLTIYSLAASRDIPNTLYAGTTNGVYQLSGGTWTPLGLSGSTVTAIAVNASMAGYIYVGTNNGSYYSPDAGTTWLPGPSQLAALTVQSINFDPFFPGMVYYSTTGDGVLRAP